MILLAVRTGRKAGIAEADTRSRARCLARFVSYSSAADASAGSDQPRRDAQRSGAVRSHA
jgi:hypothetical protein